MFPPFIFLAFVCLATTLAQDFSEFTPDSMQCVQDCQTNNKWNDASDDSWFSSDTTNEILERFCPLYKTMMGCIGKCVDINQFSDWMSTLMPESANNLIDSCSTYNAELSEIAVNEPQSQQCIMDCQTNDWIAAVSDASSYSGNATIEVLNKFCPIYIAMIICLGKCKDISQSYDELMRKSMPEPVNKLIDSCMAYNGPSVQSDEPPSQKCIMDCQTDNKWIEASDASSYSGKTREEIRGKFCPNYNKLVGCLGKCVDKSQLSDLMRKSMPEEVNEMIDSCSTHGAGQSVVPDYGIVVGVTMPVAVIVVGRMLNE